MEALDALRDEPALIIAAQSPVTAGRRDDTVGLPNVSCVMKGRLDDNIFLGAGARLRVTSA